jgi:ketosteroid isomerase-like protein
MKSILIASLLVITSSGLFAAEIPPEQTVFEAEKAWIDAGAKFDIDALEKLMRDDFIGVKEDGATLTKRQVLGEVDQATAAEKAARAKVKLTVNAIRLRLYGNVAVVVGSSTLPGTKPIDMRFTHIWVKGEKTEDPWLLSTFHLTRMTQPKPAAPAKPVRIIKPTKG